MTLVEEGEDAAPEVVVAAAEAVQAAEAEADADVVATGNPDDWREPVNSHHYS
jgi:hypothetical protein